MDVWGRGKRQAAEALLVAIQEGATLKAHRTMDGDKVHKLHHRQDTDPTVISNALVRYLEKRNLLRSNMKFPAATYLLTDQGVSLAQRLSQSTAQPLAVRAPTEHAK